MKTNTDTQPFPLTESKQILKPLIEMLFKISVSTSTKTPCSHYKNNEYLLFMHLVRVQTYKSLILWLKVLMCITDRQIFLILDLFCITNIFCNFVIYNKSTKNFVKIYWKKFYIYIYIYIYIHRVPQKKCIHTLTKENSMLYNRLL